MSETEQLEDQGHSEDQEHSEEDQSLTPTRSPHHSPSKSRSPTPPQSPSLPPFHPALMETESHNNTIGSAARLLEENEKRRKRRREQKRESLITDPIKDKENKGKNKDRKKSAVAKSAGAPATPSTSSKLKAPPLKKPRLSENNGHNTLKSRNQLDPAKQSPKKKIYPSKEFISSSSSSSSPSSSSSSASSSSGSDNENSANNSSSHTKQKKHSVKKLKKQIHSLRDSQHAFISAFQSSNKQTQEQIANIAAAVSTKAVPGLTIPPSFVPPIIAAPPAGPSITNAGINTTTRPLVEKIPNDIRVKIHNHIYVDFHDLLYPANLKQTLTVDTTAQGTHFSLAPKKSQPLSQLDWALAFDMFAAAYTESHPLATQGIITYGHRIRTFMKQGLNWLHYDTAFRQEVEIDASKGKPILWTELKMDGYLQACSNTSNTHSYNYPRQPFRDLRGHSSRYTKQGALYCFAFNREGERCKFQSCQYRHRCSKCDSNHPLFLHDKYSTQQRKEGHRYRERQQPPSPAHPRRAICSKEDAEKSSRH